MSDSQGYDFHDKYIIVHAVLAGIATTLLFPTAILIARYWRGNPTWYKVHSAINYLATLFIIIAFSVAAKGTGHGTTILKAQFEGAKSDVHHQLGLAVLLLVLCQTIIGVISHFTQYPTSTPTKILTSTRSPIRFFHIFFGIATLATCWATMYEGFLEWDDASDNGTLTPKGVKIVFYILIALLVVAYIAGWAVPAKAKGLESRKVSVDEEVSIEKH